jgi:hypothetical protein
MKNQRLKKLETNIKKKKRIKRVKRGEEEIKVT